MTAFTIILAPAPGPSIVAAGAEEADPAARMTAVQSKSDVVDIAGHDLEGALARRDFDRALAALTSLLRTIDRTGGLIAREDVDQLSVAFPQSVQEEAATRIAAAIAELFSATDFQLSEIQFRRLLPLHRWISTIFAASGFGTADFVLRRLGFVPTDAFIRSATLPQLFKLCLLYSYELAIPLDFQALFQRSPPLACGLGAALLAGRLAATPRADQKRGALLKWMTAALARLDRLDGLPIEVLADVWMNASYAADRDKHAIKRPLNRLFRTHMAARGFKGPPLLPPVAARGTIFVVLERFARGHSIMRTHSIAMQALKRRYRLIGFGPEGTVDDEGKAIFDEYHPLGRFEPSLTFLSNVVELSEKERPAAVFFPSVGMSLYSLYLVNLRLAPKQFVALGHPATTHSDAIDAVLVEEDFVGDPSLFSETVAALPKDALPYVEPVLENFQPAPRRLGQPVRVAVACTIMKLNPRFLSALRTVKERSPVSVEFHFMLGGTVGFQHVYARKAIEAQVPGAVVHAKAPYPDYMRKISACDLFANPFPFGNTNGIVDTVFLGLPGVCLTGDEVHQHIDEGLFRRMEFPEFCIAKTVEDYVETLLRLVSDGELRRRLANDLKATRPDRALYTGAPEAFAEIFAERVDGR